MLRIILAILFASVSAAQAQPKDPPKKFTNSIGMKFVLLPSGTFMMGSSNKEKGRGDDEIVHRVTLTKGFYMAVHTVTQEQWQAVMGSNPSEFKGEKNLPVDSVSWEDCQIFCQKLCVKEKTRYRLPTEAEWEYACRAGTTTPFHTGETLSTDQANYNGNSTYGDGKKGIYREKTTPVGSFAPNAWGLYDMHGNIWQWCQDWHGGYQRTDVVDPQGPKSGKYRSLRGGSFSSHAVFCRSANRTYNEPGNRTEFYGCRVCFDLE